MNRSSALLRLTTRCIQRGINTSHAQVLDGVGQQEVTSKIGAEIGNPFNRLFAIVYVNGRQFKVSEGDLISLEGPLPLKVGDKITLDKVLCVGGSNFSVFGRPLLNGSAVKVKATVTEKSTKNPELNYAHYNHKQIHIVNWMSTEMSVLRIGEIKADPSVFSS